MPHNTYTFPLLFLSDVLYGVLIAIQEKKEKRKKKMTFFQRYWVKIKSPVKIQEMFLPKEYHVPLDRSTRHLSPLKAS